jgi:nicotinate dehydrogenase subunit A
MSIMTLKVNGRTHKLDLDPATPLLYVLSDDLGLRGPKFAIRSCVTPVQSVKDSEIITLEGLGTIEKPHPLQQAFIEEQAAQCGFCVNGVIMTAKALLDKNPRPSDQQIQEALSGVLCRCFTHVRMLRAIKQAAKEMAR